MRNPFVHVELNTTDIVRAKRFYRALFAWKLKDVPMPHYTYTIIDVGEGTGGGMMKQLMPDISHDVDERAWSLLGRLSDRRGCGFLGLSDCYGCLRASGELTRALESAKSNPRPSFAPPRDLLAPAPGSSAK